MLQLDNQGGAGLAEPDVTSTSSAPPPNTNAHEAPEPAATSSDTGLDDSPSDGQPRDEHGRFAPKAEASTDPKLPTDVSEPGAQAGLSTTEANAPLDNRSPQPAQEPQKDEPKGSPLTFRAGGREQTFQGAERFPDGSVRVSAESLPRLLNDLSHAHTYQTTWRREMEESKRQHQSAIEEVTAKATSYEQVAVRLFERLEEFMETKEYNLLARELDLDLRLAGTPSRTPTTTQLQQASQSQGDAEQIRSQAQQTLFDQVLTTIAHNPAYAALTPDEQSRNDLLGYFLETMPAYFVEHEGQVVLDTHKVNAVLAREARRITDVAEAKAQAQKEVQALKEAMEKNAANAKNPDLPPVVGTRNTAPPSSGNRQFKNRAEYDAWRQANGLA